MLSFERPKCFKSSYYIDVYLHFQLNISLFLSTIMKLTVTAISSKHFFFHHIFSNHLTSFLGLVLFDIAKMHQLTTNHITFLGGQLAHKPRVNISSENYSNHLALRKIYGKANISWFIYILKHPGYLL